MKAVRSNLPKLARVPLDIGGQFPSWSFCSVMLTMNHAVDSSTYKPGGAFSVIVEYGIFTEGSLRALAAAASLCCISGRIGVIASFRDNILTSHEAAISWDWSQHVYYII